MYFLAYIWLCVAVHQGFGFDGPSFRSTWNEGGRPILRMGTPAPPEKEERVAEKKSDWVDDLRSKISNLVRGGYDAAKADIAKLVQDTESAQNVALHVKGSSNVNYKKMLRGGNLDWVPTEPPDPKWLQEFKHYIRTLIEEYGNVKLDDEIRPVIDLLEEHRNVKILDIDGDIFVKWEPVKKKKYS